MVPMLAAELEGGMVPGPSKTPTLEEEDDEMSF
jgi:hypothetical protein